MGGFFSSFDDRDYGLKHALSDWVVVLFHLFFKSVYILASGGQSVY